MAHNSKVRDCARAGYGAGAMAGIGGAVALAAMAAIALCFGAPAGAATSQVAVASFNFSPATVTIYAGDSVEWTNLGGFHNAAADGGAFRCANGCDGNGGNGNPSSAAWVATFEFDEPAQLPYHCEIHGVGGGTMTGTVVVQRAIFADGFESGIEDEWAVDDVGDSCAAPSVPTLPATGLAGDLHGARNDLDLTLNANCLSASAKGRDRMYQVVVGPGQTLQASVTPTSPGFDPALYLIAAVGCADQPLSCLDGADQAGAGGAESILFQSALASPITVLLVVDSVSAATAGSDYTLDIAFN